MNIIFKAYKQGENVNRFATMRKNSIKEASQHCEGSPTNSYLIAEEKTWITHETWIDEEETTRQSLLVNNSDLYNLKSETQKYEDEWQRKGQERCIQKRLLIASALGLEDVVERLVYSGADPCFKQNKFGFSALNFAASTRQLMVLLKLMQKRKMADVDASIESSKYQYNPLDQVYIELSHRLHDKHDEGIHMGELFSFGDGSHFQLGHGDSMPRQIPKKVKTLDGEDIAVLSSSDMHSAALTSNGKLYTWGKGDLKTHEFSKLGYEDVAVQVTPRQILSSVTCVDVATSNNHTAVATNDGSLFTFGQGADGQLGHGKSELESPIKRVLALKTKVVTNVACSDNHTVCLTSDGQVYTFGRGSHGQLGHTLFQNEPTPRLVSSLTNLIVKSISCGPNMTAALTEHDDVYYFGNGNPRPERVVFQFSNGQTGYVSIFRKCKIQQVVCDENHILVLTTSGELYIFNPKDIRKSTGGQQAAKLFNIYDKRIAYVDSNNNQALAVSEHGEVYQWNLMDEKMKPYRTLLGWRVKKIKRSKQHTLLVVDKPLPVSHRVFQAACKSLVEPDDVIVELEPQFADLKVSSGDLTEKDNEEELLEIEDLEKRYGTPREEDVEYDIPEITRKSLIEDLTELLEDRTTADVAFIIAPKPAEGDASPPSEQITVVQAHRVILSRHPHFAALFKGTQERCDRSKTILQRIPSNQLGVDREKAAVYLVEVDTKENVEACQCAMIALINYLYGNDLNMFCARKGISKELKKQIKKQLLDLAIKFNVSHVMKSLGHHVRGTQFVEPVPLTEHLRHQLTAANTNEAGNLADLRIIVEGREEVKAHKSVVSTRCQYFKMLLGTEYSHYKESSSGLIVMEDIPRETLMHVLEFIYTGQLPVKLTITQLMNMIIVADRLLLTQLSTISQIEVMKQLAIENVTSLLDNGLIFGLKWLIKGCLDFILRNVEVMIRTDCLPSYLFNSDNQSARHDEEEPRHLAAKELQDEIVQRCKDEPFEFFTVEHKEYIQRLLQEVIDELKASPAKKQQNTNSNNNNNTNGNPNSGKKKKRKNSMPYIQSQPSPTTSIPIEPKFTNQSPVNSTITPPNSFQTPPRETTPSPINTIGAARVQTSPLSATPPTTPPTKIPASPPTPWAANTVASPPRGPSLLDIQREQSKTPQQNKTQSTPVRKQPATAKTNGHSPHAKSNGNSPLNRSNDVVIVSRPRKGHAKQTSPTSTSGELNKSSETKGAAWGKVTNSPSAPQSAGKTSLVDIQREEQKRTGKPDPNKSGANGGSVWKPPPKPSSNLTRIQNEEKKKKERPGQGSGVFKSLKEIQDEEEAVAQIALFYQQNGFDEATSMKIARGEIIAPDEELYK